MPSYCAIPLGERDLWLAALEGVPHAFAHTWDHCEAIGLSSRSATYLWSASHGGERYACVVAEREYAGHADVFTPYGFTGFVGSAPWPDLEAAWRRFVAERGYVCAYLVLNPVLSAPTYFAGSATRHRTVYVLDLRRSDEELYARLSLNRKRELRRNRDSGRVVVDDQETLADFFVATYPEFMRQRDAAAVYDLTSDSLRCLCASDSTFLVGAQRSGEICTAALFGYTPYLGDYLFGVSGDGGRGHSAALIWEAALELRRLGVPYLNLGGGVVEGDGVEEFKRRFGADQMPLSSVKEIYRADVYRELCELAGVSADRDTSYFPAYREPGQFSTARR